MNPTHIPIQNTVIEHEHVIKQTYRGIHINNTELEDFFRENVLYNPENVLINAVNEIKKGHGNMAVAFALQKELLIINEARNNAVLANKELNKALKSTALENFIATQLNDKQTPNKFFCEFCKFSCSTSKGVVTHKRNCTKNPKSKKHILYREEEDEDEEADDTTDEQSES